VHDGAVLPVIGGGDAPPDRWPDATAIVYADGSVDCTGTLIAPDLVLTARHCDRAIARVSVGAPARSRLDEGELIDVTERFDDPDADVAVLRLAKASTHQPRHLVGGWLRFDVIDQAAVTIVGYGAIDPAGVEVVDPLQEAFTTITDAASNLELRAGGDGVDTCRGDSGGPLYLGGYLAGVTSRGTVPCGAGGIYVRTDAIAAWIEDATGETLAMPAPWFDGARVIADDPRGGAHTFTAIDGDANVDADGDVTGAGTVRVADAKDPKRALDVTIPGGCDAGGGGAGALVGALALLSLHGRRRLAAL